MGLLIDFVILLTSATALDKIREVNLLTVSVRANNSDILLKTDRVNTLAILNVSVNVLLITLTLSIEAVNSIASNIFLV
jgi:hypothetical protein